MPKRAPLSNERFLRRIHDYLPMDAAIWNTDSRGGECCGAFPTGLKPHRFYLFDAEAINAVTHAVAELALEEAEGSLWACLQTFREYEAHREHCWQLAATLSEVRVFGVGRVPARHGRVRFVAGRNRALSPYWAVDFHGPRMRVALVARQVKPERRFADRQYLGFYTLDPAVAERVRTDLQALAGGRAPVLAEHARLQALDEAGKALRIRFESEVQAVEAVLDRLRRRPEPLAGTRLASAGVRVGGRLGLFVQELARLAAPAGKETLR